MAAVPEPDESGTDTFQRYHYQAEAAFLHCLRCAKVGDVLSVTPERLEDLLVEERERWCFIQVKTRDAELGPWLFGDLLVDGGALRSLLRTHRALGDFDDGRQLSYEIHLEGAAKRGDDVENILLPRGQGPTEVMVRRCASRLRIDEPLASAVLARTRVRDQLPARALIRDRNIRDLERFAGPVLSTVAEAVYAAVIAAIESAMRAELLAESWPQCVMSPASIEEELATNVAAKRLVRETLAPLFEPLGEGNEAVLTFITDPGALSASELERKLITAGASQSLRDHAKQLRANASRYVFELAGGSFEAISGPLADVDLRLLVAAEAVARTTDADAPADIVWRGVLDDFAAKRDTLDPSRLLRRDPMLLAGRLCELSDLCRFGWTP